MGYSFFALAGNGYFPGRCPLTGRFCGQEVGDDEPREYTWDAITESTDDSVVSEEDNDTTDNNFDPPSLELGTSEGDEFDPSWVELVYRGQFPHLWGDGVENELNGVMRQCGSSGFGANDKPSIITSFGYGNYPGRRGHDDTRKTRKAAIRRFRRSVRSLRTVEQTLSLLY